MTLPLGTTSASEKQRRTPPTPAVRTPEEKEGNPPGTSGIPLPAPPEGSRLFSPCFFQNRDKGRQTPQSIRCLMISFDLIPLEGVSVSFLPPTTSQPAAKCREHMKTWAKGEPGMFKPLREQLFVCSCITLVLPLTCLIIRAPGEEESSVLWSTQFPYALTAKLWPRG